MAIMAKRWYRSHQKQIVIAFTMACSLYYMLPRPTLELVSEDTLEMTKRVIETKLEEALKEDKGTGCEILKLDPFDEEVTKYFEKTTPIVCNGKDWVRCHYSECRVVKEILDTTSDVVCTYRDIILVNDREYKIGPPVDIHGDRAYILTESDHVKIKCMGRKHYLILPSKWVGVATGFRQNVSTVDPPPEHKDSLNVLIFGYDSLSKNGFIRRMPKTYKYITEEMNFTIFNGYNIVGDGTVAALFAILSGTTHLEWPNIRKMTKNNNKMIDRKKFIFYKLKQYGYRTAYFEDSPNTGTFQYRFNGFGEQPADHYLRAFFLEEQLIGNPQMYCVGEQPTYRLMMNITEQLLNMANTKRFIFSFLSDVSHDDFHMLTNADAATVEFFTRFKDSGRTKDTLLMFMGDHGSRFSKTRTTLQGRLEERLPLMAVLLPSALTRARPDARAALEQNAHVLTTPHDVYATVADALRLPHLIPKFKVSGADLPRAMSFLQPIPKNRSCSEAGIAPHWCACVSWESVRHNDPVYERAGAALLTFINDLTEPVRLECVPRTLKSIEWVMKQATKKGLMESLQGKDEFGFGPPLKPNKENYQVKMIVGPGTGVFEATVIYLTTEDKFIIDKGDISRTNAYHHEPDCIHLTQPHLNNYCYCRNQV